MKKTALARVCLLALACSSFALEVDRKEIDAGSAGDTITFINYTGPHSTVSSASEISGIGSSLGKQIAGAQSAGDKDRYYVIHAVDAAAKTGFDADILVIGKDAEVDHIDNVRRILSGYLSAAYGYSDKDARTLATFITVYNAVYRGKLDMFKSRYKPVVTDNLSADNAGLSVRYDEWPGRTRIVIPLSDPRLAGTISAIDTTSLTDKAVVNKIKEDSASSTGTRKDMADLKEREADSAQTRADTAQTAAATARDDAAAKTAAAAKADKDAATAKADADKAVAVAKAQPDNAAAKADAEKKAAAADEKKAAADSAKADADKAKATVADKEKDAAADQKLADTKQSEARTERKEIAADTQADLDKKDAEATKAKESALAGAQPATAIRIVDEANLLGELVIVNLNDGTVMKTSSVNTIRGRTIVNAGTLLMAIAGKKGGSAAIKLVLVDPATLEMTKQGTESIAEQSMLVQNGNDFYAIVETETGSFALGRFDKDLAIKAKSALEVKPATAITVTDKGILVQDKGGVIKLLRATDLTDAMK
jgi:hypothetical protein